MDIQEKNEIITFVLLKLRNKQKSFERYIDIVSDIIAGFNGTLTFEISQIFFEKAIEKCKKELRGLNDENINSFSIGSCSIIIIKHLSENKIVNIHNTTKHDFIINNIEFIGAFYFCLEIIIAIKLSSYCLIKRRVDKVLINIDIKDKDIILAFIDLIDQIKKQETKKWRFL